MAPRMMGAEDKDARRRQLAQVALDVFAEKGFETASIADVAERAGIGKGTVYEYFESKDALIEASLMTWVEDMVGAIAGDLLAVADPEEQLRRFARESVEVFTKDRRTTKIALALFQLMINRRPPSRHARLFEEMLGGIRGFLVQLLRRGAEAGRFRPEIVPQAGRIAMNLMAYLDGIAIYSLIDPDGIDLPAHVETQVELLLHSFRRPATETTG